MECHTGNKWRRGRKEICRCHVHTAFRLSPNFAPGEFSALQQPSCNNSGANGGATVSHFSPHRLPRWLRWWRIHLPVQETQEMWVHSRLGRPPAVGNGNPLQYSRLETPTDGAAWRAAGLIKYWIQLSTWAHTHAPRNPRRLKSQHPRLPRDCLRVEKAGAATGPNQTPAGGRGAYSRSRNTLNHSPENYGVAQRQNQGDIWGFWPRLLCSCSKLKLAFLPVSIYQLSFERSQLMWKKMWLPGIVENPSPSISLFPENSDICQPSSGELFQVQEMC